MFDYFEANASGAAGVGEQLEDITSVAGGFYPVTSQVVVLLVISVMEVAIQDDHDVQFSLITSIIRLSQGHMTTNHAHASSCLLILNDDEDALTNKGGKTNLDSRTVAHINFKSF